jgi:hypothetical protein
MNLVAAWPLWWLDLALAALVLEAAWLALRGRRAAAALLRDWLWCLLAGLGLLLAMRLALAGAALPWVGGSLAAAGICHALDLQARGLGRQAPGRRLPR